MKIQIEDLQRQIRDIDALIEHCRRSVGYDPEARCALAMLQACKDERVKRLRQVLH